MSLYPDSEYCPGKEILTYQHTLKTHMELTLPDCTDWDLNITLTPEEEEELLMEIAEKGKEGLDDFVSGYRASLAGSKMQDRLRKFRERIEKQADRMLEEKRGELSGEKTEKEKALFREMEKLKNKKPHLIADPEKIQLMNIEDVMEKDDLLKLIKDQGPETLFEKIRSFFLGIYVWFVKIWVRLKEFFSGKIKRKKSKTRRKKPRKTLSLFGGKTKFNIGADVSELLRKPRIRTELKRELKKTGKYSRANFNEGAEEILEQHMEAAALNELEKEREEYRKKETEREEKARQLDNELEKERKKNRRERDKKLENLRAKLKKKTEDPLKRLMERNLVELGFIQHQGEELVPTTALLERFADLIFHKEIANLPTGRSRSGKSERKLGIYEKARLRSVAEESRMDIVTSKVNSRLNHPGDPHIYDQDIIVYREESSVSTHVMIMFDMSSSMVENHRMEAAKRTVMALYKAVRRQREKDRIDIIGFETKVSLMDLMSVWKSEPRGFTNIPGALRTARILFNESDADLKIAYLITDGLPEAYTDDNGNEVAGEPDKCMRYALEEAKMFNGQLTMILLEPGDQTYVDAGKKIINELQGKLVISDPKKLVSEVLGDFLG